MKSGLRLLLHVCLVLFPVVLRAQGPCAWNESQSTQVSNPCRVAIGPGFTSPWGGLHVQGIGQSTNNPLVFPGATGQGASLFLQDMGPDGGNGGMLVFGATAGHFAAIKGALSDGAGHSLGHMVFATRNLPTDHHLAERMRIHADGHVTIGTTVPKGVLHLFKSDPGETIFWSVLDAAISSNTTVSGRGEVVSATHNVASGVTNGGNLTGSHMVAYNTGTGTLGSTTGLALFSGNGTSGTVGTSTGAYIQVGGGTTTNGYGIWLTDVAATTGYGIYQTGTNDFNYFAGRIGIGTLTPSFPLDVNGNARVTGDLTVTGNIGAKYQDVAEWVPAAEDLAPGTVVILDPALQNTVAISKSSYDTTVAGVVSAQPGIILGEAAATKEQIATTGRVKVRADARNAPIAIGDLLVTSDTPGMAMKSRAVEVGGIAMHRPGTIIGKALEPLQSGQGEILVLLSLQ